MKKICLIGLILMMNNFLYAKTQKLNMMVYNVENLFDGQHDAGKNDWAYLPKDFKGKTKECNSIPNPRYRKQCLEGNWTAKHLKVKFLQIEKMVKSKGVLPDLLALSEIENQNVIQALAGHLGYQKIMVSNSPDQRGIDLALLFNEKNGLVFKNKREHVLAGEYFNKRPSRNILEVEFLWKKEPLFVFVNHWPSLSNPQKTRLIAARTLKDRIDNILKINKKARIMAVGDFNTIPENHPHPFSTILESDNKIVDLHTTFMKSRKVKKDTKKAMPLGTYFYAPKMTWNLLDRVFLSTNLLRSKKGIKVDLNSYEIVAPKWAQTTFKYDDKNQPHFNSIIHGVPWRYDHLSADQKTAGYSDHYPLWLTLNLD